MLCKQYTLLSLVNIRLCKVYEKDFSLPTEIEKQRNQDFFLGSLFFLLTSKNILKFTTISVKIGDGICTSQNQLWFPHFRKHGQSQNSESTEAHFHPCPIDVVMLSSNLGMHPKASSCWCRGCFSRASGLEGQSHLFVSLGNTSPAY